MKENREFIQGLKDSRVTVITNENNIGQSKSVNKALKIARGTYIIRMDADDVMLPNRISDEVAYMEQHPDVIVAGALVIRSSDRRIIPRVYPNFESFEVGLLFANDMVHPSMIIRREMALECGLCYDEDYLYAQDYKFWVDALGCGRVGFIKKPVLIYRVHPGQIDNTKKGERPAYSKRARQQAFAHFGVELTSEEAELLFCFVNGQDFSGFRICQILRKKCNESMNSSTFSYFKRELSFRTFKAGVRCICRKQARLALLSGEFWKSAVKFWYWPFYFKSTQLKKVSNKFSNLY